MITLDPRLCRIRSKEAVEQEVRRIVRNTRFAFVNGRDAVRLLGPDMYYHAFDPYLSHTLERLQVPTSLSGILSYKTHVTGFDLCLEDSWSGFFIAEHLGRCHNVKDLTIIHLDDHADMMPTLLANDRGGFLHDTTTGVVFEPSSPQSWASSIFSGGVGIGSFLVPLFYGEWRTHVRHINNAGPDLACKQGVGRAPIYHDLMPTTPFAAVRLSYSPGTEDHGTYVSTSSCRAALDDMPDGSVIVHVDLDYFINDINGNARTDDYDCTAELMDAGLWKMESFFLALQEREVTVDRWIVATSPGFCGAQHWHRLLGALASQIVAYCHRPEIVQSHDHRS